MVQVVCQRCGEKNEDEQLNQAHFKLKHAPGCGSKIGIVVVSSKATAKSIEEPTDVEKATEPTEEKPKKVKRIKKSEQSDS